MASGDTPKRRAAPLPATDSATDVDDATDPRARRPTEGGGVEATRVSPMPAEPEPERRPRRPQQQTKRRDDATSWPDEMPARSKRPMPRTTEIYDAENPDVVGAPERTVIAPLPPQEESVEPVPMPRAATRSDEPRRERSSARDDTGAGTRVEGRPRRDDTRNRRSDHDDDRESARSRRPERDDGRADRPSRKPRRDVPDQSLVRQNTQIERTGDETPGKRLRLAWRDVWHATVFAVKHHWGVLRTQGLKPYVEASRPYVQRAIVIVRSWAIRAKVIAVKSAVRVGLVKPRRLEYELETSDRADRSRAEAWRRFHDGRKSSSYLQDDE